MLAFFDSADTIPARPLTDRCVVLDLDETLVHSLEDYTLSKLKVYSDPAMIEVRSRIHTFDIQDVDKPRGTGQTTDICAIERPHAREFLRFCFGYFRVVAVWSAGTPAYVAGVVARLFRTLRPPALVYARNRCRDTAKGLDKPLEKMMKDPVVRPYMDLTNTLIIDDRASTFSEANPDNGVLIPPYKPRPTREEIAADDTALPRIAEWLQEPAVIQARDVRSLDKREIFDGPPAAAS